MKDRVVISAGRRKVGRWTIPTGVLGDGSPEAFTTGTQRLVAAFVAAFAGFARPDRCTVDLMELGGDGRVLRVVEAKPVPVVAGQPALPDEADILTAAFLDCALRLFDGDRGSPRWRPDAAELYVGCVVEFDESDRARPVDSQASVTVTTDAWTGPGSDRNRERLDAALRNWEARTASPITEYSSSVYGREITRYGFEDHTVSRVRVDLRKSPTVVRYAIGIAVAAIVAGLAYAFGDRSAPGWFERWAPLLGVVAIVVYAFLFARWAQRRRGR